MTTVELVYRAVILLLLFVSVANQAYPQRGAALVFGYGLVIAGLWAIGHMPVIP
jgi:hypothetical protein